MAAPIATGSFAPGLITIRALDIQRWADETEARSLLPVLIRKLVHSTGHDLTHVDFPGYDSAERPGWDGIIDASHPTSWIPAGRSGWELGTGKNPGDKASSDYEKRIRLVSPGERATMTFIFVTPREWTQKDEWASKRRTLGGWKDVRAYDSSDLEQWVEQSAPTQVWLGEELELPVEGYRSLDKFWLNWASVSDPALSPTLFNPAIGAHTDKFEKWLLDSSAGPMVIAADSTDEALAFLSCLSGCDQFKGNEWGSRTIVIDSPRVVDKLALAPPGSIIAVTSEPDVERKLASLYRDVPCVFAHHRNSVGSKPTVVLDRLTYEDFEVALEDIDIPRDQIDRLGRESARSPTLLRRRLSVVDAIQVPVWAKDFEMAKKLIPLAMIGSWRRDSDADIEVLKKLVKADSYGSIESDENVLMGLEDSPIWQAGEYGGVVSKLDALFAVGIQITKEQLDDFFLLAENVLSESDPALDLPEGHRWMAALYHKMREHSTVIRDGICETLVMLAAHGSDFLVESHYDVEQRVSELVRKLIGPFDVENLMSNDQDLPNYAEAAPEVFLEKIEADLQKQQSSVLDLLKPVANPLFDRSSRVSLLWALERLAWNPEYFPRVVHILAKMCSVKITDNLSNRPVATLQMTLNSLMPQTAASIEQRKLALDTLVRKYPETGWTICIEQLRTGRRILMPSQRPRWRSDASGAGNGVSNEEVREFVAHAIRQALSWSVHDESTLGDLIDQAAMLSETEQGELWDLIGRWAGETVSDDAKGELLNRIRHTTDLLTGNNRRVKEIIDKLMPHDPVVQHKWLFSSQWMRLPDDLEDHDLSYQERDSRLLKRRVDALREIWDAKGCDGISAMVEGSPQIAQVVGGILPKVLRETEQLEQFVHYCLVSAAGDYSSSYAICLEALLRWVEQDATVHLVNDLEKCLGDNDLLLLFLTMPCRKYDVAHAGQQDD